MLELLTLNCYTYYEYVINSDEVQTYLMLWFFLCRNI